MPRPLVLIHGWSDTSKSFRTLASELGHRLNRSAAVINLADYVSMDDEVRFDDLVSAMAIAWKDAGLPTAAGSVDVLVHSTGGLVIRDWLTRFYEPENAPIKHLVMLAPANFGSPLAHKGRALIGRVVKGFQSQKPFETGTRILKGLELASPYSWQLAFRDRFSSKSYYQPGRVLCTVLVGNTGYSGISAAANEDGSDGTVRVSAANLNCAFIAADFSQDPHKPLFTARSSTGTTAFRVIDGENHSTIAMKDKGPRSPETLDLIQRALEIGDADFDAWARECDHATRLVTAKAESEDEDYKFAYQNIVFHVIDDAGIPVAEYLVEFFMNDEDDKKDFFAEFFHRDIIRTVHTYCDDGSYRSMLVDVTTLRRAPLESGLAEPYMNLSLVVEPYLLKNGYVGYRSFNDEDIGSIRLNAADIDRLFQPNRTVFVEIKVRRERSPEIFRIKPLA